MTRTRASAKSAGSAFERSIADCLKVQLGNDDIDRRVKTGNKDRGDIHAVRFHGQRLVLECKDYASPRMGTWWGQAEVERGNDDALAAMVVHKRHGKGNPLDQWVTMTVRELVSLINAQRPTEEAA